MFDQSIENKLRDTMHEMIADYQKKWNDELIAFTSMKADLKEQKNKFALIDKLNKELPHIFH